MTSITVNFSDSVFDTETSAGSVNGLQPPVVARVVAEVARDLLLALQQLLHGVDDAGRADLLVLVGLEGAAQAEGVDGAAVAWSKRSARR